MLEIFADLRVARNFRALSFRIPCFFLHIFTAMTLESQDRTNYEELKALLTNQLEESGGMAELRALVKTHVLSAVNSTPHPGVNQKLKSDEHGHLMLSLTMDFLDHFGLTRSLQVLRAETDFLPLDRDALQLALQLNLSHSPHCLLHSLVSSSVPSATHPVPALIGQPAEEEEEDVSDSIEADMAKLRSLNAQIDAEFSRSFDFAPSLRGSMEELRLVDPTDSIEEVYEDEHFEPLSDSSN